MRRTIGVLFVLLSMLGLSQSASAQEAGRGSSGEQASGLFSLQPNYPNPFNPETTIPFRLEEGLFADGRPVVVSMRIFNMLRQPVGVPAAVRHPEGDVSVVELEYTAAGLHEAFWDGRDFSGNQVASGAYFVQLTVNGVSKHIKVFVAK